MSLLGGAYSDSDVEEETDSQLILDEYSPSPPLAGTIGEGIRTQDKEPSEEVDLIPEELVQHLPKDVKPGKPDPRVVEIVEKNIRMSEESGMDIAKVLRDRKDINNPATLSTICDRGDVYEGGSNYPEHLFSPCNYDPGSQF